MKRILIYLFLIGIFKTAIGQIDAVETNLRTYFPKNYLSDGQIYRTMITPDEVGEFQVTFFANIRYRVAIASTLNAPNKIIFRMLDPERNILFSNRDFDNSPYWDFQFTGTINCIIEVEIAPEIDKSAIALMMIGYQQ